VRPSRLGCFAAEHLRMRELRVLESLFDADGGVVLGDV
jgi:hypothetical protein